jgi:hypothetical protein
LLVVSGVFLAACGDDDDASNGVGGVCFTGTVVTDGGCTIADAGPAPDDDDDDGDGKDKPSKPGLSCGDGTVEKDGQCVAVPVDAGKPPAAAPERGPVGAACKTDKDCQKGTRCLTGDTLPGNFCTVINCDMDTPCPAGSTCYQATETSTICMPYCDTGSDCREGYNCQPLYTNAINICAPSCAISDACPSGTQCNEDNGLCEIKGCDPNAKKPKCGKDETCWPDTKGLSSKGGLCLRLCDPGSPDTCMPERNEVCQPLESDPKDSGFCATPVCSKTEECPAGAICHDSVCQPPALCDEENPCDDDDTTCVAGKCMTKCPRGDDSACTDQHPGLTCATELEEPACLPIGTFPGSPCRANRDDACSPLAVGGGSVPMICQDDVCLPTCEDGGDALCGAISDTLACAVGILDQPTCLPKGTFPGGPCGPSDFCTEDLAGNPALDMQCVSGTCLVGCDESEQFAGYGDALCQFVDPSLTCSESAGSFCVPSCQEAECGDGMSCRDAGEVPAHENACLPNGSFPGSACGGEDGDECDALFEGAVAQTCTPAGVCAIVCNGGDEGDNDDFCAGIDPSLTCAETPGHICVIGCVGGNCLPGDSCLDEGGENACLPTGTFPGSPCRDTEGDECSPLAPGVNQVCVNDTCVVACNGEDEEDNDDLCAGVDASLTCAESAGHLCVIGCVSGNCLPGFSCLDEGGENACLPTGSFPGSPCRAGDECDEELPTGEPLTCKAGTCVVNCDTDGDAVADDAVCAGVDASLTCSETAGNICVPQCGEGGTCADGFSCLKPGTENACLPDGTFPGSACSGGTTCFDVSSGVHQTCLGGETCAVTCTTGGSDAQNDAFCGGVGAVLGIPLTCSETASNICVIPCQGPGNACLEGYFCMNPGTENACLPIP